VRQRAEGAAGVLRGESQATTEPSIEDRARVYRRGSRIIRPVQAQVGETVRIKWRNHAGETIEQDHTAPPPDTWKARTRSTE